MSWLFLVVSLLGAVLTANALWPRRGRLLLLPSFVASWLTIELAGHQLLAQAVIAAVFVWSGALDAWPGWVGLAVTGASWVGLLVIIQQARASSATVRDCLEEVVGDGPVPRVPRRHVLAPAVLVKRAGVRRIRDVEYGRAGGRRLHLDVYRPRHGDGDRRPAVLQVHGGAWVMGDKRQQGIPLLTHLADNGWIGFNVNYRLSPAATFPDHLVDVKRALAWVREHADDLGIDPGFVAVTGGSAGGHLTALMALTEDDPAYQPGFEAADTSVQAAVPFYAVYDLTDRLRLRDEEFFTRLIEPYVIKAFRHEEPARFSEASPVDRVHAAAPPFLVIHGDNDTLVSIDEARLFVERLRAVSRRPVFSMELHGAQHAFDLFASLRTARVIEGIERFLAWAYERHCAEKPSRREQPLARGA